MPKFTDEWVVDKTLFDYISGGSCACCGFQHLFNPDGLAGLIKEVTDLETDAAKDELSAAERSPWPPDMRDQVWADRVRLRFKMKKEMKVYKEFWDGVEEGEIVRWCTETLGAKGLVKLCQMPRSEVTERVKDHYGIHSAFAIVLCTVVEQVAHFKVTGYENDARGPAEIRFEELLVFDRRCGFTLPFKDRNGDLDENVVSMFVDVMKSLSGPKLLMRGPKKTAVGEEEEGEGEAAEEVLPGSRGPSFRSDRRIVRLVIAKYWTDLIMEKYREETRRDAVEKVEEEGG